MDLPPTRRPEALGSTQGALRLREAPQLELGHPQAEPALLVAGAELDRGRVGRERVVESTAVSRRAAPSFSQMRFPSMVALALVSRLMPFSSALTRPLARISLPSISQPSAVFLAPMPLPSL